MSLYSQFNPVTVLWSGRGGWHLPAAQVVAAYKEVYLLYCVCILSLAQSQQYDQDGVIDIFRQYGDHLYNKGDHDGAIAQYIKTISKLEASYVIRKVRCKPLLYGQLSETIFDCNGLFTLPDTDSNPDPRTDIHPKNRCSSDWGSGSRSETRSMASNGDNFCMVQCIHRI